VKPEDHPSTRLFDLHADRVSPGPLATGAPERYVHGLSGRRGLQLAEEKATEAKAQKGWPRRAKAGGKKACTVAECKRPYRAKGYCFFHFKKWRQGDLPHTRYRVCSKPECRTKTARGGLCEKHYDETYKAAKTPAAEASTAPTQKAPAAEAPKAPAKPPAAETPAS
jgi:hypothetical protein